MLGAFGVLGFLALPRKKAAESGQSALPSPTTVAQSDDTAKPASGGGEELSTRTKSSVNWKKAKRILEPDVTGPNWRALTTKGKSEMTVVPCTIKGHPFARQIEIAELGANPWDLQLAHPLDVAFKKGSHVRLTYWGRSAEGCTIAAVVEQATEPYTKVASRNVKLTPEWKQYSEEWLQTADTESGWAHIDFQVGYQKGTIELTGVQLDAVK